MLLSDLVDEMLIRDGVVNYEFSGPPAQVQAELEGRVGACIRSASVQLAKQLVKDAPGTGFEIDVDCQYDDAVKSVEAEVLIRMLPGQDVPTSVSMGLLHSGFRYLALHNQFNIELSIGLT